ncbi:hypothetical protein WICPIJ_004234 [Wickerhamomyces pijperi]|uniref:HMG box domain-containing protein n=1 Tax=Wickerhamomyces pijperi TaxID=599730 RepID=A0A9P8TN33_WICPI|nr:hypothetical protein WICPIJ_004234 [Wickerhamomyces pijperi]
MLSLFNRQTFAAFPRQSTIALFSTSSLTLLKQTKKVTATSHEAKKPKKEKSPVKRQVSAYSFFTKEIWATKKNELSGLSTFAEKSKHINQLWKNLAATEREKFTQLAQDDLARFRADSAAFEATLPPKKPISAYLRYVKEHSSDLYQKNPSSSFVEISKMVANKWNALTEAEKQVYKDSYIKDFKEWKEQNIKA